MKKFLKVCGIIALVLLILGLIISIVAGTVIGRETIKNVTSAVTGGRVNVNLDNWDDWGIQIKNIFPGFWDDVDYEINDSLDFNDRYEIYKGDVDKYCLGKTVTELNIEAGGCGVEMRDSGDDSFYVEARKIGKFQGYVENKTLYIKTTTGTKKWNEKNNKVILYVPAGHTYESAHVSLGAGKLTFPKLSAESIQMEVGAGEINLENVTADRLEATVGMGGIYLNNMHLGQLTAEIGMGNLEADGSVTENIHATCSMGNLSMTLEGRQEDYNYNIIASLGNVDLGENSYCGLSSDKYIDNSSDKEMEVECSMGNISIQFKN